MTILTAYANSYAADGALSGWGNPANAYTDNGVYATRQANEKNVVYGSLFGFDLSALPAGATINSVTLIAEWHNSANDTNGPKLLLGAKTAGVELGSAIDTSGKTGDEVHVYAPTSLTAAQLKATGDLGFWAIVRFYRTDNVAHIAYLDYVKVEIDYTEGGLAEILGAAEITVDAFGQVVEGAVTVSGVGAIAFDGLTASITGTLEFPAVEGAMTAAFANITAGMTGAVAIAGEGAAVLAGLTADITGTVQEQDAITASTSITLDGMGASAAGAVGVNGASSTAFDGIGASGNGAVVITGESSNTFSSTSMDATGLTGIAGSASKALDGVTGEIIGVVGNAPVSGLLEVLFSGATCQMVGVVTVSGAGVALLAPLTCGCTGTVADTTALPISPRKVVCRAIEHKVRVTSSERTVQGRVEDRTFFISIDDRNFFIGD